MSAQVGTLLRDKWHLDALLGEGGTASVFAATHRNGSRGAIKVLHPSLAEDPQIRGRFLREGYVANKIAHPGVVQVLDDDVTKDGLVFLVMELLHGATVKQRWVQHGRRLPPEQVLALAEAVLDVLATAHEKGIVHRDIKPDNIFVLDDGKLKLLDFGIARFREEAIELTEAGAMLGTPAFMAPEQARGTSADVDGRSDLFSVGAAMWTLMTGTLVHAETTKVGLLVAAATKPARAFSTVMPDASLQLRDVVDRALAFDPRDRWSSALEMLVAVRRARRSLGSKTVRICAASSPPSLGTQRLEVIPFPAPVRPAPTLIDDDDASEAITMTTPRACLERYG